MQGQLAVLEELEAQLKQLTATPMGRRTFIASMPLLLASCATAQHRQREGNNVATVMTPADERKLTEEVMPEMRKDYPAFADASAQNYIQGLGRKIARANGLEGNPYNYNFTLVGVKQVNAFALPAGTIFVTAPLIAMAETEAELAGVVGHEIGHVKAKHAAQRMETQKRESGKSILYGAGGGILGGALGFGLGKLICKKDDKSCLVKTAGLGAAAGAAGGLLIQKYYFMANSREDEMEADRIGFRTSVQSGYDKNHVGTFYAKLLRMEQDAKQKQGAAGALGFVADALSTHPPSQERVNQMQQLAAETRQGGKAVVSTKEFDRVKALAVNWTRSQS